MEKFFAMGGYGFYVWGSYGAFLIGILIDFLATLFLKRSTRKALKTYYMRQQKRFPG